MEPVACKPRDKKCFPQCQSLWNSIESKRQKCFQQFSKNSQNDFNNATPSSFISIALIYIELLCYSEWNLVATNIS